MDFTFLADKIKAQLAELQPGKAPLCVIRGSGGFNDESGESYIIPYDEVIYLFNRKFSDPDFEARCADFADVGEILLNHEAFSAVLSIQVGSDTVTLKISSIEIQNATLMLEQFEKIRDIKAKVVQGQSGDGSQISPLLGLVAMLMFIAAGDGEIADEEQELISRFCGDDKLYNQAYDWYRDKTFEETIAALELNEQQKMCCLANILELAMVDGAYDSREQKLVKSFTDAIGLPEDKIRTIEKVLLIKNQLSVL